MRGLSLNQKYFFSEGMQKLVDLWTKCVEKDGDYIEKLYYCKYSQLSYYLIKNLLQMHSDSPSYKLF
jgi:hypothetical protein